MKLRRIIGLDVDWLKMARIQEVMVVNEARIARLRRQLEEMADLLEQGQERQDADASEPAKDGA